MNEVKGLVGLDRYFKQIAQSARTNSVDETIDDYLGSVNIRLIDLPSSGLDKWYELQANSDKSKITGRIQVRLKLTTTPNQTELETDGWNYFKQHENLLKIFINHELNKLVVVVGDTNKSPLKWNGVLSREAETILHQHAIQNDLTDFQIVLW